MEQERLHYTIGQEIQYYRVDLTIFGFNTEVSIPTTFNRDEAEKHIRFWIDYRLSGLVADHLISQDAMDRVQSDVTDLVTDALNKLYPKITKCTPDGCNLNPNSHPITDYTEVHP